MVFASDLTDKVFAPGSALQQDVTVGETGR